MFDSLSVKESRPLVFLRRAVLVFLALCFVTALASGHRAYFQVRGLELRVAGPVLRAGSVVETEVVSSGRTHVDVRVELVQGAHAETLAVQSVRGNEWGSIDPRAPRVAGGRARAGCPLALPCGRGRPARDRHGPPAVDAPAPADRARVRGRDSLSMTFPGRPAKLLSSNARGGIMRRGGYGRGRLLMRIHERKMKFGSEADGGLGDRLVRQVLDGTKTATCELKAFCTGQEVADLDAEPGWLETVVDGAGRPRCNVRVTAVYETTFGSPDPRLMRGEGCGDDSEEFRRGHGRWFDALLKEKGLPPLTDDSALVVWEFELIETA